MSRDEIPKFLKSVRCELISFYSVNRARKNQFNNLTNPVNKDQRRVRSDSVEAAQFAYLDLSDELFAPIILEAKVVDTFGLPGGSTVSSADYKHTLNTTHSFAWHFAPVANTQNTYDLTYSFLIQQNAEVFVTNDLDDDGFTCYNQTKLWNLYGVSNFKDAAVLENVARGRYIEAENFKRLTVVGTNAAHLPLAGWLLDNGIAQWNNSDIAHGDKEIRSLVSAQTLFNFIVQFTGGLEARYTLVGPILSGAPDANLNTQQTSNLQFWLNGPNAVNVLPAKIGGVAVKKKDLETITAIPAPGITGNKGHFIAPFGLPLPP